MKYYKSNNGQVFAYESDGSQDAYIKTDLVPMTPEEVEAHINPQPTQEEAAAAQREAWKAQRAAMVADIKVEVEGKVFDGDEISQGRMARAILGLQSAGPNETVTWVLADNTVIDADVHLLESALALAGAEQARLWVAP